VLAEELLSRLNREEVFQHAFPASLWMFGVLSCVKLGRVGNRAHALHMLGMLGGLSYEWKLERQGIDPHQAYTEMGRKGAAVRGGKRDTAKAMASGSTHYIDNAVARTASRSPLCR
jgi:hypothetical protein